MLSLFYFQISNVVPIAKSNSRFDYTSFQKKITELVLKLVWTNCSLLGWNELSIKMVGVLPCSFRLETRSKYVFGWTSLENATPNRMLIRAIPINMMKAVKDKLILILTILSRLFCRIERKIRYVLASGFFQFIYKFLSRTRLIFLSHHGCIVLLQAN